MGSARTRFAAAFTVCLVAFSAAASADDAAAPAGGGPQPLTLIVMDPLSAPLSCDCVKGYAQRKYELLGAHLSERLRRKVDVYWSESLEKALQDKTHGAFDLVIGKSSVVLHDAQHADVELTPLARLTGKDGATTQTGLFVVRFADPAVEVADLAEYRIFFGPEDCDEKSAAPMRLLEEHGVAAPAEPEVFGACSEAASALVELPADVRAAAVISSYAEPLLEGCGSVKKGDLRVIGETPPLPFITAFVRSSLSTAEQAALLDALLAVGERPDLCAGLETKAGFVAVEEEANSHAAAETSAKKKN